VYNRCSGESSGSGTSIPARRSRGAPIETSSASCDSIHVDPLERAYLDLDLDLVGQAREVLGSNGTTETVHRALEEVVRQEKLRWLAERDFSELTPEVLERLRATRTW